MTFRVRDELRDLVGEMARSEGRSLSEQIEYLVEKCVLLEISSAYNQNHGPIPTRTTSHNDGKNQNSVDEGAKLSRDFGFGGETGNSNLLSNGVLSCDIDVSRSLHSVGGVDKFPRLENRSRSKQSVRANRRAVDQTVLIKAERELALRRTERERSLEAELTRAWAEIEMLRVSAPKTTPRLGGEGGIPLSAEVIEDRLTRVLSRSGGVSDPAVDIAAASAEDRMTDLLETLRILVVAYDRE